MRRQVDTTQTKQVRIDTRLHSQLKIRAAQKGISIRALIEDELGFNSLVVEGEQQERTEQS